LPCTEVGQLRVSRPTHSREARDRWI
jgi:hypothetical protein